MEWIGRNAMKIGPFDAFIFLFFVVVLVELGRIAQTQDLTGGVTGENAVRPLGLERDDGDIPRTGPICRRNAPARQPFKRLELENGARRPDGADRRNCWSLHTVTFSPRPSYRA